MFLMVLGLVVMRLPILIALAVSVVWVADAPRGAVRSVALSALGLLALTALGGVVLNAVPIWLLSQEGFDSAVTLSRWMGGGKFVLEMVQAVGIVLLVWAMTRALRSTAAARS